MVKNIHCESNKCTLVSWVDKILNQSLFKQYIKSGFKDTRIWLLNPKAMDHKTGPFKVYTSTLTNISNNDNEGFDDTTNGQEKWEEGGAITQLMNITIILQELETL
jgi:hypothetical protein